MGTVIGSRAEVLHLKNGAVLECLSIAREGDFLTVNVAGGSAKVPRENLAAEERTKYFPDEKTEKEPQKEEIKFRNLRAPVRPKELPATPVTVAPAPANDQAEAQPLTVNAVTADKSDSVRADFLPAKLPSRPDRVMQKNYKAKKVEYTLPCRMANQKKVTIQALVPVDEFGKVPESAAHIVFYAPTFTDKLLHRLREHDQRIYWELCEHYGLTVFSAGYNTKLEDVDEREKCYYYHESGAFEPVLEARERLVREFELDRKKMYIIGNSGGSSMAERMGLLYPNEIAAIVLLGGGRYEPVGKKVDIPWLVINTRGDPRAGENQELVEQLRSQGMNALYAQTEPAAGSEKDFERQHDSNFHHTISSYGFDLAREFIAEMTAKHNTLPPAFPVPSRWPCFAPVSDICHVQDNVKPVTEVNPYVQKIFFPSKEFAALWQSMPYRVVQLDDFAEENAKLEIWARYPVRSQPVKGLVLYNSGADGFDSYTGDEIDFMALKGFVIISANFSKGELNKLRQTKIMLDWVLKWQESKSLPIYLLGIKTGGRHLLLASGNFNDSRMKIAYVIDAPLTWPFPELSPLDQIHKLNVSVCLFATNDEQNYEIELYSKKVVENGFDVKIDNSLRNDTNINRTHMLEKILTSK